MTRTIATIAAALALCLAALPAAAQNREHQQMAAELRMLQEQSQQLSIALSQALTQLTEAIKTINTRLDASDAATRKALADQKVIIDSVNSELRVLRERTQDTNTRIGTLAEEIEAMRTSQPSLSTQVPPVEPSDPALAGGVALPAGQAEAGPSRSGLSPTRLFQTAYSDFASGNFALAITGFENYVREFPRFERADDAELYIGESYVKQKKYPDAIAAFTRVVQNYPTGDKVPEAYLKLGETQRALNQTDAARSSWQKVVSSYPESAAAILAKQRLDGLPPAPAGQP